MHLLNHASAAMTLAYLGLDQAVSNWERGKSYPDISNIIMISDLYSISLDELI